MIQSKTVENHCQAGLYFQCGAPPAELEGNQIYLFITHWIPHTQLFQKYRPIKNCIKTMCENYKICLFI